MGFLVSTKANVKETQRLAEKLVTLARQGTDFNTRRRAKAMLPYKDEALTKLICRYCTKICITTRRLHARDPYGQKNGRYRGDCKTRMGLIA